MRILQLYFCIVQLFLLIDHKFLLGLQGYIFLNYWLKTKRISAWHLLVLRFRMKRIQR
jgi:hypothetical protein